MMKPRYAYPVRNIVVLIGDILTYRSRNFRSDAITYTSNLQPSLRLIAEENVPNSGPNLITFNHYYRPGFRAWWLALAIASVVPVDMYWVITAEWTFPGRWYAPLGKCISRYVLKRLARTYGFTCMPPMPPRPQDTEARAHAVREVLSIVQEQKDIVVGLAPEGSDMPGGKLSWPPSGVGRFVILLARAGLRIVPVGAYEENGAFCLNFGQSYELHIPSGLSSQEKDRTAARIIQEHIALQLPQRLRGEFGHSC